MKNITKSAAVLVAIFLFVSCNNDDSTINNLSGTGNLGIEFDNSFAGNELTLNLPNIPTSNDEVLKISTVKYIISNIVLYDESGASYTYPKSQSYFIVDESDETTHVIDLNNIPAGNYTKIKFGIGVDQPQYDLGQSNQGSFYDKAQSAGLMANWDSGYSFIAFDGTFTSQSVTSESNFSVRARKTDSDYNYKEVILDLPARALVRTTITPEIHIVADVAIIIDGVNKIRLSDDATVDSGAKVALVADNVKTMFSVAHVHND